jgi:hypothetical protein
MGSDKGHWHPHAASREFFCEKVAASAPDGTGNLATWVLAQKKRTVAYKEDASFKMRLDDALSAAIDMTAPEPSLVFDLVVTDKTSVYRERSGRDVWSFWEVVDALGLQPGIDARAAGVVEAVDDLHGGDFDAACAKLRAVVLEEMGPYAGRRPELRRSIGTLDRISPPEEAPEPTAPRM